MRFKKIYIEITNICNKNCSFCSKDKRKKREMTLEEFKLVIQKIKNHTNYVYLHVKGEPLSHSKFKQILEICKNNSINVNITTNATFLNEQVDNLIRNNVRQVNISVSSLEIEECKNIVQSVMNLTKNNIHVVYRFWALSNGLLDSKNKKN